MKRERWKLLAIGCWSLVLYLMTNVEAFQPADGSWAWLILPAGGIVLFGWLVIPAVWEHFFGEFPTADSEQDLEFYRRIEKQKKK